MCLWACFWVRLKFKIVDWVKQAALPNVDGPHPICWGFSRTRRRKGEIRKSGRSKDWKLLPRKVGNHWVFWIQEWNSQIWKLCLLVRASLFFPGLGFCVTFSGVSRQTPWIFLFPEANWIFANLGSCVFLNLTGLLSDLHLIYLLHSVNIFDHLPYLYIYVYMKVKLLVAKSWLTLPTHGPWPTRLLCPWNSPCKNTGVGSHSLLQGRRGVSKGEGEDPVDLPGLGIELRSLAWAGRFFTTEPPGKSKYVWLQSMRWQRVGHDLITK